MGLTRRSTRRFSRCAREPRVNAGVGPHERKWQMVQGRALGHRAAGRSKAPRKRFTPRLRHMLGELSPLRRCAPVGQTLRHRGRLARPLCLFAQLGKRLERTSKRKQTILSGGSAGRCVLGFSQVRRVEHMRSNKAFQPTVLALRARPAAERRR